jgi:hypothetical protein
MELQSRLSDPAIPNPGAFLYGLATHHLDDHGAAPDPRPDCYQCAEFAAGPKGVRADIWRRWALTHYMSCQLASDPPAL